MNPNGRDNQTPVDDAPSQPLRPPAPPTASSEPPGSPPAPPPHRHRHWLKLTLKWSLCLTVVIYVGRAIARGFADIHWHTVHFRIMPLILCGASLVGMFAAQLFVYRQLLKAYARPIPWRAMIPVAWLSALGKYVPGNFAAVAGKIYLLHRHGVSGSVAFSLAVLQDGMAAVAGLLVATPLLGALDTKAPSSALLAAAIAGLIAGAVCLHPRVFARIANLLLRRLKRPALRGNLTTAEYAGPLLGTFAQWLFSGLALWCMIAAICPIAMAQIPFCIAACALAMTIGYLVFFAPAGIGPREGILLALLSPLIGVPNASLTVLAFRVAQTLVEVLLAGAGVLAMRR